MQTTSHFRRVVATTAVLAVGALTLGASAGVAAQHEPKLGLGYPSQAAGDTIRDSAATGIYGQGGPGGTGPKGPKQRARQHDWTRGIDYSPPKSGGVRNVDIRDAAHMALLENARRHGLKVKNMKPIGSRQFYVGSRVPDSEPAQGANASGAFGWTYPGVLAGLSLGFVLLAGGIVMVARRFKSRTVTA